MNSTVEQSAIATTTEPERIIVVHTPQRKARYSDKYRIKRKDIKIIALKYCGCQNTAQMKEKLSAVGIKLDLRLTAAWIAIAWELQWLINGDNEPPFCSISPVELEPELTVVNAPPLEAVEPPVFNSDIDEMNWVLNTYAPVSLPRSKDTGLSPRSLSWDF